MMTGGGGRVKASRTWPLVERTFGRGSHLGDAAGIGPEGRVWSGTACREAGLRAWRS
jgi:hypothetical protein